MLSKDGDRVAAPTITLADVERELPICLARLRRARDADDEFACQVLEDQLDRLLRWHSRIRRPEPRPSHL